MVVLRLEEMETILGVPVSAQEGRRCSDLGSVALLISDVVLGIS